jgi:protein ImuB
LELAAYPPGAAVLKIWVTAQPAPPRTAQRGLFLPVTPEPERLEITLARIGSIVGERRAGLARLFDSHHRESFSIDRFTCAVNEASRTSRPTMSDVSDHVPLAVRIMRPARPLQVCLSAGRPDTLASEGEAEQTKIQGKVVWSAGPWRSSGYWWTENRKQDAATRESSSCSWDREEWDIALAAVNNSQENNTNVSLYRIYRDMATGKWFADAIYD